MSPSAKSYTHVAGKKAVQDFLNRKGVLGEVADIQGMENIYQIKMGRGAKGFVSVVIPVLPNDVYFIQRRIEKIFTTTVYCEFEIVLIMCKSEYDMICDRINVIQLQYQGRLKLIQYESNFDSSAMCNKASETVRGEFMLLLNSNVEVISPEWLGEMLGWFSFPHIGVVGPHLLSEDKIAHAGFITGVGGVAGHGHFGYPRDSLGYMGMLRVAFNCSAVSGVCLLVRKADFISVGGLDQSFRFAFSDIDLCLKIRKLGKVALVTPGASVLLASSNDVNPAHCDFSKDIDIISDGQLMLDRWRKEIECDPYYHPSMSRHVASMFKVEAGDTSRRDFNSR